MSGPREDSVKEETETRTEIAPAEPARGDARPSGTRVKSAFAKAAAFAKAIAAGPKGKAADIFAWEHGVAVEPWPEPVNGKELLDALMRTLQLFVFLPKWAAETVALWILHTYAFQLRDVTTYIGIESPEKRCGKTTLLAVLCELVNRPVVASNISSPAFFRVIEEKEPALMIDEADSILHGNHQLKGILNSGYTRNTAYVVRVQNRRTGYGPRDQETRDQGATDQGTTGNGTTDNETEEQGTVERGRKSDLARFSSWCPKAIATVKHLPEILADRCIVLELQRKTRFEKCERLRRLDGTELRRKCARFVLDHAEEIADMEPELPEDLNDRAADIWEPLLALADLAGGDWPERARNAALGLTAVAQEESPMGALLLDLMIMFVRLKSDYAGAGSEQPGPDGALSGRAFSRDLVAILNSCTDRPWLALRRGKEITETWLAQQLRPYGVRPKTIWIGETAAKGYLEADFEDTFRRYIPKAAVMAYLAQMKEAQQTRPAEKPKEAEGAKPSAGAADSLKSLAALKFLSRKR